MAGLGFVIIFTFHTLLQTHPEPMPIVEPIQKTEVVEVVEAKPAEPPKPIVWAFTSVPRTDVSLEWANAALAFYQQKGLTKTGAAYILGNYMQEMPVAFQYGDPCHVSGFGDGGDALGFGQWHPGRRYDMPCGFYEQLDWALLEMDRDAAGMGYSSLKDALQTDDIALIKDRIKRWERYGVEGRRFSYGDYLLNHLTEQ